MMFTLEFESEDRNRVYTNVLEYQIREFGSGCVQVWYNHIVNVVTGEMQGDYETLDGVLDIYNEDYELFDSFELASNERLSEAEEPVNECSFSPAGSGIKLSDEDAWEIAETLCKARESYCSLLNENGKFDRTVPEWAALSKIATQVNNLGFHFNFKTRMPDKETFSSAGWGGEYKKENDPKQKDECPCDNISLSPDDAQWIARMFCELRKNWVDAVNGQITGKYFIEPCWEGTLANVAEKLGCELDRSTLMLRED